MNLKRLSHPLVWVAAAIIGLGVAASLYYSSRLDVPLPVPPAQAEQAPKFELPDLAGNTVRLEDFGGKILLLHVWTAPCDPCVEEMQVLEKFRKSRPRELAVVGVALKTTPDEARRLVGSLGVKYPVLLGDESFARKYRSDDLPRTFLIDKFGRLRSSMPHPSGNLYDYFHALVNSIAAERGQ